MPELFISLVLPVLIGLLVWAFFHRDLRHFREAETLKVGELQALVQRHRWAVMLHFALLLILLPLMIFYMAGFSVLGAILLAGVFLGHVSALSRMSRPIIASLQIRNQRHSQIREEIEDEAFAEEVEAARKRLDP
jgi:hypothetical protein